MKEGFNKTVYYGYGIGNALGGGFILFLIASALAELAEIFDNAFTKFLWILALILLYFWPMIILANGIDEHEDIKNSFGEEYGYLIKRYEIRHPKYRSVFWISLLLGWTVIGWLIAVCRAGSKELIDLPDSMVDELNNLAGIRTSHPPDHSEEVQPDNVNEPVATDAKPPALPVRLKGTCESCGARYSILLKPRDHAECDHCGSPIGT